MTRPGDVKVEPMPTPEESLREARRLAADTTKRAPAGSLTPTPSRPGRRTTTPEEWAADLKSRYDPEIAAAALGEETPEERKARLAGERRAKAAAELETMSFAASMRIGPAPRVDPTSMRVVSDPIEESRAADLHATELEKQRQRDAERAKDAEARRRADEARPKERVTWPR